MDLDGRAVSVITGQLMTPYGPQVGLRTGQHGAVVFPDRTAIDLVFNLREAIAAQMRTEGEL